MTSCKAFICSDHFSLTCVSGIEEEAVSDSCEIKDYLSVKEAEERTYKQIFTDINISEQTKME